MLTLLEYFLMAILIAVNIAVSHWLGQQAYFWMPPQGSIKTNFASEIELVSF